MSTHKYFDRICIAVLITTILATVLFMNGKSLGLVSVIDEDAETYEGDVNFTKNDYNGTWEKEDACTITLDGDSAKVKGNTLTSSPRPANSVRTSLDKNFELLPVT